jgi:hypothetical protein
VFEQFDIPLAPELSVALMGGVVAVEFAAVRILI